MFIGFDYGTANCSVAVMRDGKPHLLKMENDSTLLPSMLCAPTREAVSEWLYRHHDVPADDDETQALLRRAIRYNREEDIDVTAKSVQFGLSSLAQYIDDPEEVWFVKSPKSFLGASGLKPQQVALFEDLRTHREGKAGTGRHRLHPDHAVYGHLVFVRHGQSGERECGPPAGCRQEAGDPDVYRGPCQQGRCYRRPEGHGAHRGYGSLL